jgi:hypothetical protein
LWPAIILVSTLTLDLLQYCWGTLVWGAFARHYEKPGTSEEQDLDAPRWFNWPTLACFWTKLAAVVCAYGLLLNFLAHRILDAG